MKTIHRRLRERIQISHEAIFVLLVLILLLTAYFHGKARHDAIALGKGAGNGVTLSETGGGESLRAGSPSDGRNLWHGMERVLAALEEADEAAVEELQALQDAGNGPNGPMGGDSDGESPGARDYALLGQLGTGGLFGSLSGSGESPDSQSSNAPSSESWGTLLASLSPPAPQGYGRGGGMGSYPAALSGQQPGPGETVMPASGGEGSGGNSGGPGGIAGLPLNPGPLDNPGTGPPADPGKPPGPVNPVPEPATLLMLCLGLLGIREARSC